MLICAHWQRGYLRRNHRTLTFVQLPPMKIQRHDKRNKRSLAIPLAIRRIDAKLLARIET